jgi:hypothetical protein
MNKKKEEHETRKTHPSVNFIWWDRAAPLRKDGASLENGQGPISKKTKNLTIKNYFYLNFFFFIKGGLGHC